MRWTAFPLHPETPDEGRTLDDLFAGRGIDIPAVLARLQSAAADLGLPLADRRMTYNSRRAQELGKWAEQHGRGEPYHHAVFAAYFAEGRNIAQWEVLAEIVSAAGLDPEAAAQVLHQGTCRPAVDADWQRCRTLGITAVPTFHINNRLLVGAQPYESIRNFLQSSIL